MLIYYMTAKKHELLNSHWRGKMLNDWTTVAARKQRNVAVVVGVTEPTSQLLLFCKNSQTKREFLCRDLQNFEISPESMKFSIY